MFVDIICLRTVFRTQSDWRGAATERCRPSGGGADLLRVGRKSDIERVPPYQLEERSIHRLGQPKRDARRVRERHFLGIDRRMLRLLGVGTLQLVTGGAPVPEVSTKERAQC